MTPSPPHRAHGPIPGRIKAVFFDLDDTLVLTKHIDAQAYAKVCELARALLPALDEARLIADWRALFGAQPWDPQHQVEVELWRAGLWQKALGEQGLECSPEAAAQLQACFSGTRLELFQFLPGVEEMVDALAGAGYTLVIITNGHHTIQRQKVESCRAGRLFPHILVGGEEILAGRHEKPHPAIFERACALAQCRPEEAVHVGDSLSCDVQGGANAGLAATVWINPAGRAPPEGGPRPDHIISTVLELPGVLQALEEAGRNGNNGGKAAAAASGSGGTDGGGGGAKATP